MAAPCSQQIARSPGWNRRCARPLSSVVRRHMIRALKSVFAGMRASRCLGRAFRLRDCGDKTQALVVARDALNLLSAPYVNRHNPPEGSALVAATVLVEELASELRVAGASRTDITDTLTFLEHLRGSGSEYERWIPYLKQRQTQGASGAV